jgi:hypothetical protein
MAEKATNPVQAQEDKLKAALKGLGNGKNKVADALRERKIKGEIGSINDCPIAKFVGKVFRGRYQSMEVDHDFIHVTFAKGEVTVPTPKAVAAFMNDFDQEKYPDLIAK